MKKYIAKENVLLLISLILLVSFIFSVKSCSKQNNEIKIAEQNLKASLNESRLLKDKNGKLYAEKDLYISEINDLKTINEDLYNSIKSMKAKVSSGVSTKIIMTDTINVHDTIFMKDTSVYDFSFNVSDQYFTGNFNSVFIKDPTQLILKNFEYSVDVPIEVYFTEDYKAIIKSKNENVKFSDIDGFISPSFHNYYEKKTHWSLSLSAGPGLFIGKDIITNKFDLGYGMFFGISVSYNILKW